MEIIEKNKRKFQVPAPPKAYVIFDRTDPLNQADIAGCAALAMNKAIIGVCELDALETSEGISGIPLRSSKAVQVYYIVYHLFTCCMLMDSKYELRFNKNDMQGKPFSYGCDTQELKERACEPDEWNERKEKEKDLATCIAHGGIKSYCNRLRNTVKRNGINRISSDLRVLYDSFIRTEGAIILYEKAAYIRDRSIYRPSYVASLSDAMTQTSLDVRAQDDSLPNSKVLYSIVESIHKAICSSLVEPLKESYALNFLVFNDVDCKTEYAHKLGYSWDALEELGGNREQESVPSAIAQMMELYPQEHTLKYYKKYFLPLLERTKKKLKR